MLAQALPTEGVTVARPRLEVQIPPPAAPNPTHQPSQPEAASAEDMVARAMALSATQVAATTGDNGETLQLRPHGGNSPAGGDGSIGTQPTAPVANSLAAAEGKPTGEISEEDLPDSEDETADMDVQVRDGETSEQHSSRIKRLLKERLQRDRASRGLHKEKEERKAKSKDGKDQKEKPRAKATLKK